MSEIESIFDLLQKKSTDNIKIKDAIKSATDSVDDNYRLCARDIAKIHSYNSDSNVESKDYLNSITEKLDSSIVGLTQSFRDLAQLANNYPFYKYNSLWTHSVQNVIFVLLIRNWLVRSNEANQVVLLSPSDVSGIVGYKCELDFDQPTDEFHFTSDEYLQAVISLSNELARFAITSVTAGFTWYPKQIENFLKELQASFMVLNLKNDSLRRRFDSLKYDIKKVEEVVYDLSIRGVE